MRCSPRLAPWIHVLPGVGKGALHMRRRARGCSPQQRPEGQTRTAPQQHEDTQEHPLQKQNGVAEATPSV